MSSSIVEDFDTNFFSYATTLYKICGLWHSDSIKYWTGTWVFLGRLNVFIIFGWAFIISTFSGAYLLLIDGEMNRCMDCITFGLAYMTMQYKFILITRNEKIIRGFFRTLEHWSRQYPDKRNVQRTLGIFKKLFIGSTVLIAAVCIGYCVAPLVSRNRLYLPLHTAFTFGLDVRRSPVFELYIVWETIGTVSHAVISTAFDMMYAGILLTTGAILQNLNSKMKINLTDSKIEAKKKHSLLLQYVREHREILRFLQEIKGLFMVSNLFHFAYNYTNAGELLFQLSKQPIGSLQFFSMCGGCTSVVFALFAYCESGQSVTNAMHEFWKNLYFTDWYMQSRQFKKDLYFIMLCTQDDFFIMAGGLVTLSRETEKNILRAIFTYYTFLLKVNSTE